MRLALAAFLTLGGIAHAGNLIDLTYGVGAGSFELGPFVNGGGGGGGVDFMALAPGSTTITGWTVGGPGDGVDWITGPTYGADTGNFALDLQHTTASSISTVIPTLNGAVYQLLFRAASVTGWT